jgi:hypothetical protein
MGAEQMLHAYSDPMRPLVMAYALSMVVAPFETALAQALVDTGECAAGYDVTGDQLSEEERGAKCGGAAARMAVRPGGGSARGRGW